MVAAAPALLLLLLTRRVELEDGLLERGAEQLAGQAQDGRRLALPREKKKEGPVSHRQATRGQSATAYRSGRSSDDDVGHAVGWGAMMLWCTHSPATPLTHLPSSAIISKRFTVSSFPTMSLSCKATARRPASGRRAGPTSQAR